MKTDELETRIYVLKEVNKILVKKRDEFQRLINKNETVIREAESLVLKSKKLKYTGVARNDKH